MASLSSSRRNSSSSSTGRRSSRMDSLCEEDQGSVFGGSTNSVTSRTNSSNVESIARLRSPSLPVVTQQPPTGIARSRSPSLPVTEGQSAETGTHSPRRSYYADRSDSGISDCSTHSSTLLSGSHMPTLIQEEEDESCTDTNDLLTNGSSSLRVTGGGSTVPRQIDSGRHSGHNSLKSNSVVKSRHSVDSAIGE